jgi:hypothetical protein
MFKKSINASAELQTSLRNKSSFNKKLWGGGVSY